MKNAFARTPVGSLLAVYPHPPPPPLAPPLAPPPQVVDMPEHHPGQMGGTMRLGKRKTLFKTKDCITCKSCSECGMEDLIVCVRTAKANTCSRHSTLFAATDVLSYMPVWLMCGCVTLCTCMCDHECFPSMPRPSLAQYLLPSSLSLFLPFVLNPPLPSLPSFPSPLSSLFSGKLYRGADFVEERHRHRYEVRTYTSMYGEGGGVISGVADRPSPSCVCCVGIGRTGAEVCMYMYDNVAVFNDSQ